MRNCDLNIQLLLLDGQGVVFNRPLAEFLAWVALVTGQSADEVRRRWFEELRVPFWAGRLGERVFWDRLTSGSADCDWSAEFERRFSTGLAASALASWSSQVSIRMLSNHRGTWLRRRLDRFGLSMFIERVVVSDEIGVAKPDPAAFMAAIHDEESAAHVLFVDDQIANVRTARNLGMHAVHAGEDPGWITLVSRYLDGDGRQLLAEVFESDRAR